MAEGIRTTLTQVASWLGLPPPARDTHFDGVSTDSRAEVGGSLFVALRGERHDAHDHLVEVAKHGAVAALVERPAEIDLPQLVVSDTREALGRLAAFWRRELELPLVAITGSNGKTTVKEMVAAILSQAGQTLATRGNLNNDIGVPLTLLCLERSHAFAVVEMGANHPGEIAYLTALARPQVAVITNAAPAHLAGFGSVEGVARAKGEIFGGLAVEGTAIINADDPHAGLWQELAAGKRIIRFGLNAPAEVSARLGGGGQLEVQLPDGRFEARLALPGQHNARNALAACAVTLALGISPQVMAAGLESLQAPKGRLQSKLGLKGSLIIDDSYNANPASLAAGMEVLATVEGRRILVLGDMGELGESAAQLHTEAGRKARSLGLDKLFAFGPLSRNAAEAFGAGGFAFDQLEALVGALREELGPKVTVLVKGSRSMRMERVVKALGAEQFGESDAVVSG